MRNMSFMLTTQQMYDKTKTVTRRIGWWYLKPGDVVMACEKCQGLKKGEKIKRIHPIKIVSVNKEPLEHIKLPFFYCPSEETAREGFPNLSAVEFVKMFRKEMKCKVYTVVNRIEFEHLDTNEE